MIKSKLKLYLSSLLLISLAVVVLLAFAGCGNKVEQIYVDNSHSPRLNYVQGQELDLERGILTAVIGGDGEESLIPMTDAGVSVTGYNKDTLGSQTLIVNYEGKTTTITVNVIPRITAEGFETGYFTDDAFKSNKGKLKVAKDDATTTLIAMDDPRVTLVSFDSSTPGEKTVTVRYSDGTNSYDCSFNVVVYDAATSTIDVVFPKKTNYGSHETHLDYTGGYLTIKGGAGGTLEKHVDITDAMTSGYDFSLVNATNTSDTQTVTITYLKQTFTYEINISYSGVSKIKDQFETLREVDLEAENLVLTEEEKKASWIAASEYFALKSDEKKYITEEDANTIIRIAAVAVSDLYKEELKNYEDTIVISAEAAMIVAKSYETTVRDLEKFKDSNELINRYSALLRSILKDYSDLTVMGEKKVGEVVFVMPEEFEKNLVGMLSHLTELHLFMADVPENWTEQTLRIYEPQLYRIKVTIQNAPYYRGGQGNIYQILSDWRTKNDYFEIFYTYYLYCNEQYGEKEVVEQLLDNVPWPKKIDTWYGYWYNLTAMSQQFKESLSQQQPKNFMTDITPYMYYFKLLTDGANEIKNNQTTDKLTYDLYRLIAGDLRINNVRYDLYGYLKLKGFMADENKFIDMWNTYLELVDLYAKGNLIASDGKVITEGYEEKYEAVMNKLVELSPAELHEFLSSLNFLYGKTNSDVFALTVYTVTPEKGEPYSTYLSTLSTLMNAYYRTVFNDTEYEIFVNLLKAMESYARTNKVTSAKETFMNSMASAIAAYNGLSDKSLFNEKMGLGYSAYVKLYEACLDENNVSVEGDGLEYINSLLSSSVKFKDLYNLILSENEKPEDERNLRNEAYMLLFALFEDTRYSYLYLADMAEDNDALRIALYKNLYDFGEEKLTVEQIFASIGNSFWTCMLRMPEIGTTVNGTKYSYHLYDIYIGSDMPTFLLYAVDMLYAEFYGNDVEEFTETAVKNMVSEYNKLDSMAIGVFNIFNINDLYFSFIERYTDAVIEDGTENKAFADKLIEAAKACALLQSSPSEEARNSFKSLMTAATELRNQLTAEDTLPEYIRAMYDYYESIVNSMNQPQQ